MNNMTINKNIRGFRCIRCSSPHPIGDYFEGCPSCANSGFPSSVVPIYSALSPTNVGPDWLAYPGPAVMGEGSTPLIELPRLGQQLGLPTVYLKNEASNPTGSHKDRMSQQIVRRAIDIGHTRVAAASSGNAGASLAAFAAHAGIDCTVIATKTIDPVWRRAIESFGASLILTETVDERWRLLADHARRGRWYPATNYTIPSVGSNPFGVDGYRMIAFELFQEIGSDATDIVVPTSRGDLLWGIAKGYQDLAAAGLVTNVPRVHAVEPFARICRVINGEDYRSKFPGTTRQVSLGGTTVAFQVLDAFAMAGGTAIIAGDTEAAAARRELASFGIYPELASAASLAGLRRLMQSGVIGQDANVILLVTSGGFKDGAF